MAYGLRLRIEYNDINDVLTRINIYQDGYSGSADVRYANAGMSIEWGDQGSDAPPLIYGSSCTVYFDAEFDYEFSFIYEADARQHLMSVEKAGAAFWTGFIDPDGWSEPLVATPYPVSLTAYDGLGFLKDTAFVDTLGDYYTGYKTIFEILEICLLKTGLSLNINSSIDWIESSQTAGTDLLKVHKKGCDQFAGLSCYEVIEELLRNCRILQRLGQWWIVSNTNWTRGTFGYFRTTPTGTLSTGTIDPTATGYWYEGEATMDILPAIKELVVVQDYGYNNNLVENGDFQDYDRDLETFQGWENMGGVTPNPRELNADGDVYVVVPGRQYPSNFSSQGYGLQTMGIRYRIPVKETTSVVKIAMKYALLGKGGCLMFIGIRLYGTSNTYFLRYTPYVKLEREYIWVDVDDMAAQGDDRLCLGTHLEKSRSYVYYDPGKKHYYLNTFDNITAYPLATIQDHFESWNATIPGLPEDGELEIFLYVPYSPSFDIAGSCFTGISVQMLDETEEEYPTQMSYKASNSARNNFVPEPLTVKVGDFPNITNSEVIYSGGIVRSDLSHTTGWKVTGGSTYYTFAEFIARTMAAAQRSPRKSYQCRIADIIPALNMVLEDTNNSNIRLIENGITYDDRFQAIDGRYSEILSLSTEQPTITSAEVFEEASGSSGTSNPKPIPNPTNADERVTVATTEGIKTSAPAFMDDEYFAAYQNEATGFSVVRPRRKQLAIAFTSTTTPQITNYDDDYADDYGQYPFARLIETEGSGNAVSRPELPYFTKVDGLVDTISFGTLPDAISGFIILE
jgi:hypothetical protein